jgi:hypothetical protein
VKVCQLLYAHLLRALSELITAHSAPGGRTVHDAGHCLVAFALLFRHLVTIRLLLLGALLYLLLFLLLSLKHTHTADVREVV